jgi:hypothetical protein
MLSCCLRCPTPLRLDAYAGFALCGSAANLATPSDAYQAVVLTPLREVNEASKTMIEYLARGVELVAA